MEQARIIFNDDEFDRVVHCGLKEGGDLRFVFKDRATVGGKPGCAITFTVQLPSGAVVIAQAVTTAALLAGVAAAIRGRYGESA